MCQIQDINEMDCTNYFDKIVERLLLAIMHPVTFMSIITRKVKNYNTIKTIDLNKQNKRFSKKDPVTQQTNSTLEDFKIGDLVRIRPKEEILKTLDKNHKFEGCLFMEEMWKYCGTEHKILKKVDFFFDEANGRMCKARNTVLLEGVNCSGKLQQQKVNCDRFCLLFWKKEWLEKIK